MPQVVVPLTVRDLTAKDLPACSWSGPATHLASIARALERARLGEVDYLAACPPSGLPVALCGVGYAETPGAGTLWQLAVHGALLIGGLPGLCSRAVHAAAEGWGARWRAVPGCGCAAAGSPWPRRARRAMAPPAATRTAAAASPAE